MLVKTPPKTKLVPVKPAPTRGTSPAQLDVPHRGRSKVVRDSVIRFLFWSAAVLGLVAAGTLLLSTPLAERLSLREATARSVAYANSVVKPLVDKKVLAGDPGATQALVHLMSSRMADGSIAHMKIWTRDGRVLWSDERGVTGRKFELEPDVEELFGTTEATGQVSDLDKPENAQERSEEELIEVYVGFSADDGTPLVFEAYWPTERIRQDVSDIRWQFTTLGLVALLLLALALLPLALSLARRVDRGLAEREEMMAQALSASDLERRRLSQDLHDGIVQDIVALGYALPTVAAALPHEATAARALLEQVHHDVARGVAGVRELLTDVYPADLEHGGLEHAVQELAERHRRNGTEVVVAVDLRLGEPLAVAQLTYRVVREALRNVAKHARATEVEVTAEVEDDRATVEVRDDGVGLRGASDVADETTSTDGLPGGEGHLGLRLLRDTLRTFGGDVTISERPGGGTVLRATFPLALRPVSTR
ncbi:sensor histidine kinase [Terrabacter terrigena]|uniref:Sensor histidine kinase n=1 Tax=Terrabacter terrigena TaxID=574718 RepID=A0ABW3MQK3_9MICO